MPGEDVGQQLRRGLRRLTWTTIALIAAVAGVVAFAWLSAASSRDDLAREAGRTNRALCALRRDLERRVQGSEAFLRKHPDGLSGIPASTIRVGLVGQRRTIMALSRLKCDAPEGAKDRR